MKSAVLLSLASGALALPASPAAQAPSPAKHVSMGRKHLLTRADGSANVAGILASLNQTLSKWGSTPLPYYAPVAAQQEAMIAESRRSKAKRQANEPLKDQYSGDSEDAAYYGEITVGSGDGNAQTFETIFDTGSADIWIPGPDCGFSAGCVHRPKYDQGGTALGTNTSIQYGSGSTEGANYVDDVTVAGLTSSNQTLISVTSAYGFRSLDADGIVGMAFSSIAQDKGTTFFESLVNDGTVDTDEFGFYMGRIASGTEEDSVMTLGGRDSSFYTGDFTTVPVSSETYWQIALDDVVVNGKSGGSNTPGQAAIDTGTTVVLAPTTAAKQIMRKIDGTYGISLRGEVIYIFPCNTSAEYVPSITFAGESFQINPIDFNLGAFTSEEDLDMLTLGNTQLRDELKASIDLSNYCISGLIGGDVSSTTNLYVVGDVFIKNWYTVMSYSANDGEPAVLFAPSIGQSS